MNNSPEQKPASVHTYHTSFSSHNILLRHNISEASFDNNSSTVFTMSDTVDKHRKPSMVVDTSAVGSLVTDDSYTTVASSRSDSLVDSESYEASQPPKSYLETLFETSNHSPPKNKDGQIPKREKIEVDRRISALRPLWWVTDDSYEKLAWMIGKDLDLYILDSKWARYPGGVFFLTSQLLNESCDMGQRFQAVYNSDGDKLSPESKVSSLSSYTDLLPIWITDGSENSDTVYTIFCDQAHTNVRVFHRFQASGYCFLQGPILIHWYKSLWEQREVAAEDIQFIHLSKYVRNTFDGDRLFDHIVNDVGGDARDIAEDIMPDTSHQAIPSGTSFEKVRDMMKDHGPGLVSIYNLYSDIHEPGTFSYTGTRPKKMKGEVRTGHAMVAVGVRKDANDKVHLLLQNFWEDKEFLEVDYDYLKASNGKLHFFRVVGMELGASFDCYSPRTYKEAAGSTRIAQSSKFLEGPLKGVRMRESQSEYSE
jgi:hypothetical protein